MNTVDIVVPCYNYAHLLSRCVESVVSQRDVHVRVLILNDASPDNTDEVGRSLAAANSQVSYLKNDRNLGLIATANRGLMEWVEAEYTLLLSADDLLTPSALARACKVMQDHEDVHMVYGQSRLIGDDFDANQILDMDGGLEYRILSGQDFLKRNFTHINPVPSPTAVLRAQVQKKLGGYLPQFPHTSDMEMWMRFAAHGPIGVIRNVQACYRIHAASMSAPKLVRALSDRQECLETCEYVVNIWCADIPEAQTWLNAMRGKMSKDAYWLATLPHFRDDQKQACAEFAKRNDSSGPLSFPRLKYELKKRVSWLIPSKQPEKPVGHGVFESDTYGWWPGAN